MPDRTPSSPDHTPHALELVQFKTEVYCLLQAQSPRARSLLSFVQRTLRQYHLEGLHHEFEIFNEAYMRGVTCILKGKSIKSPRAWMRTTTLYVICELSRASKRCQSLEHEYYSEGLMVEESSIELDIQTVQAALRELEPSDRLIVTLRVVEDLSWKQVQQRLLELGEPYQTEEALRKRGQRMMQRLREEFHRHHPFNSPVV